MRVAAVAGKPERQQRSCKGSRAGRGSPRHGGEAARGVALGGEAPEAAARAMPVGDAGKVAQQPLESWAGLRSSRGGCSCTCKTF